MTPSNQAPGTWTAAARFIKKHWIWALVLATTLVYAPLAGNTGDEKARQRNLDILAEIMGLVQKNTVDPPTSKQTTLAEVLGTIQKHGIEPPAPQRLTHATIQGMLHSLDPHSNYMDENEYRMLRENQRGSFFGIGSIIQQQPDGIVIVSTVRGGPSEKAGIRAGDYIREIDGKNTEGWTSAQAA